MLKKNGSKLRNKFKEFLVASKNLKLSQQGFIRLWLTRKVDPRTGDYLPLLHAETCLRAPPGSERNALKRFRTPDTLKLERLRMERNFIKISERNSSNLSKWKKNAT
jgi:hypothetical protein